MTEIKFIPLYLAFFRYCARNKFTSVVLKGSSRSGKTGNVMRWFAFLATQGLQFELVVVGRSYKFLKNGAFKDLKKILPDAKFTRNQQMECRYRNALIIFKSYENEEEAKGAEYDYAYFNECNDLRKEVVDQITMRTIECCFFDFNPTKKFWIEEFINEDKTNYLCTTWKDNPHLRPSQIFRFEQIKKNAEALKASVYDKYLYHVYYLGVYGDLVGNVFNKVYDLTNEEYTTLTSNFKKIYGLDFGYSNDPCALVEISIFGNKIFIKELYFKNMTDDFMLSDVIKNNCKKTFPVVYDFGSGGDARAANIFKLTRQTLVKAINGKKIMNGIALMQGFEFYLNGENVTKEFKGYEFKDGKFTDINNHTIDAARYAIEYAIRSGYFKYSSKTMEEKMNGKKEEKNTD